MVAPDHVQAVFEVEFPQQLKNVFVGLEYRSEMEVFPKFIAIPQFAIMVPFPEIVVQCVKIDVSVVREIVGEAVVTAVAITEKDEFRRKS